MTIGCLLGILGDSLPEEIKPAASWDASVYSTVRIADDSKSVEEAEIEHWATFDPLAFLFPRLDARIWKNQTNNFTSHPTFSVNQFFHRRSNFEIGEKDGIATRDNTTSKVSTWWMTSFLRLDIMSVFVVLTLPSPINQFGYGHICFLNISAGAAGNGQQILVQTDDQRRLQLFASGLANRGFVPESTYRGNTPFVIGIQMNSTRTNWNLFFPGLSAFYSLPSSSFGNAPPGSPDTASFSGYVQFQLPLRSAVIHEVNLYTSLTDKQFSDIRTSLRQKWNAD